MNQSAAFEAGNSVGTLAGYIVIYGGILALGYFFGNRLGRRREGVFVRWPLGVAILLVLILLAGQCSSSAEVAARANPRSGLNG